MNIDNIDKTANRWAFMFYFVLSIMFSMFRFLMFCVLCYSFFNWPQNTTIGLLIIQGAIAVVDRFISRCSEEASKNVK